MTDLTEIETAALQAIFAETPAMASALQRQLEYAKVKSRENTGGGFLTYMAVAEDAPRLECSNVLGYDTHARIEGLEYGLGFVLFMKHGHLQLLEGFAWGPQSTASLDLTSLSFEIFNEPTQRLD